MITAAGGIVVGLFLDIMRHVTSVGFVCFKFELVDGSLS